jgi:hypothetical protein
MALVEYKRWVAAEERASADPVKHQVRVWEPGGQLTWGHSRRTCAPADGGRLVSCIQPLSGMPGHS